MSIQTYRKSADLIIDNLFIVTLIIKPIRN